MSLWNVSDIPTALLMQKFYKNLKVGQTKSTSLRNAKAWLRNLTAHELEEISKSDPHFAQLTRGVGQAVTATKGQQVDNKPFAHPYYWPAFVLTGDPL